MNQKCLDYNTFSGKYKTGLLVIEATEAFKGRPLNDFEYQKAALLGWIVVFVSAALNLPFPEVTSVVPAALLFLRVRQYRRSGHDESWKIVMAKVGRRRVQGA